LDAKVSEISPAVLGEGEDDDDVSTGAAGGHMSDEEELGWWRTRKAAALAHGQGTFYAPTWAYRPIILSSVQHLVLTGPRISFHGLIINRQSTNFRIRSDPKFRIQILRREEFLISTRIWIIRI